MQKTQSNQLKKSLLNTNTFEQTNEQSSTIEELISRIQSTILQTSDSIKQQLQSFEHQQLISYKNDLFKTQDQFIKVRAQRNQDVIKNKIMKQKVRVEEKFSIEMKKSMEMNAKYEEMKQFVKKMNDEERELILEINYMKKKIEKENAEGKRLDEEIEQMKSKSVTGSNSKKISKMDHERKLFTDLVNRCDRAPNHPCNSSSNSKGNTMKNTKNLISNQQQTTQQKPTTAQNHQNKIQRKIKTEISTLKDYISSIPLELNFVQDKLYGTIIDKMSPSVVDEVQEEENCADDGEVQEKQQKEGVENDEFTQNQPTLHNKGNNKFTKLPNIHSHLNDKTISKTQQTKPTVKTTQCVSPKFSNTSNTQGSQKTKGSSTSSQISQKFLDVDQLPKSSVLLEEILSDPQVKQYLYKILFQ